MPVKITNETYEQAQELMLLLSQGRDLPKFQEEIKELTINVAANIVSDAVAYVSPASFTAKAVTFDVDPVWGVGTIFNIIGSTSNDGAYTVESSVGAVYSILETFNVEAGTAVSTATESNVENTSVNVLSYASTSTLTFATDPHWGIGRTFAITGSTDNDGTFTISGYAAGTYTVEEAIVTGNDDGAAASTPPAAVDIGAFLSTTTIVFLVDPVWGEATSFTVAGSTSNDGVYTVASVANGIYTVNETFTVEDAVGVGAVDSALVSISDDAANYIQFELFNEFREGDDSEKNKKKIYAIHDTLSAYSA